MNAIAARALAVLAVVVGGVAAIPGCTTLPKSRWRTGLEAASENPLFRAPKNWKIVQERRTDTLYQADLENRVGGGRLLVAQLKNGPEVEAVAAHVRKVHRSMIERVRERVEVESAPGMQALEWKNGAVGYRSAFRGRLHARRVWLRGVSVSDGPTTCIVYVLVPEYMNERSQLLVESILETLRPVRDSELRAAFDEGEGSEEGAGDVPDDLPSVVPDRD